MKWIAALVVAWWLCSCAKAPLPPLPKVETAGFEPAVRLAVDRALSAAAAAPEDAARVAELGEVLHAHEQFAAAAAAYRRALALGAPAEVGYFLGVVLAADGQYGAAVEPLRRAVAARPDSVPVRLKLADALLAAGRPEEAGQEYAAVVARDSQAAAAYYGLGRARGGAEAEANYRKALAIFPRYGAAQFALAGVYRRAGQVAEAEAVLTNYERDKATSPPVDDAALGQVYARSVSSTGLLRKGQILEQQGDLAGALAAHEQVVQSNPKLDQAWVNMISLYARLGQPAKAEEVFARATALAPNRSDAYYNFGVFCVGRERWAEAGKHFERALALDAKNAEAAHNLGAVVERTGDLRRAAALFRQAIELKPEHRQAHFHLGRIYANERRYAEAAIELEKAIPPADAESPTYVYALAAVKARAGKKQEAYELLQRARSEALRFGQGPLVAAIERDLAAVTR